MSIINRREGEKFTLNLVEEEYRKALQCDPKLTEALIFLGDLLFEQISYRGDEGTAILIHDLLMGANRVYRDKLPSL